MGRSHCALSKRGLRARKVIWRNFGVMVVRPWIRVLGLAALAPDTCLFLTFK